MQEEDRVTWGLLKIEMASHHTLQNCNLTRQREITTQQSMPAADIDRSIDDMQDRRGCHSYGMNSGVRRWVSGSGVRI